MERSAKTSAWTRPKRSSRPKKMPGTTKASGSGAHERDDEPVAIRTRFGVPDGAHAGQQAQPVGDQQEQEDTEDERGESAPACSAGAAHDVGQELDRQLEDARRSARHERR